MCGVLGLCAFDFGERCDDLRTQLQQRHHILPHKSEAKGKKSCCSSVQFQSFPTSPNRHCSSLPAAREQTNHTTSSTMHECILHCFERWVHSKRFVWPNDEFFVGARSIDADCRGVVGGIAQRPTQCCNGCIRCIGFVLRLKKCCVDLFFFFVIHTGCSAAVCPRFDESSAGCIRQIMTCVGGQVTELCVPRSRPTANCRECVSHFSAAPQVVVQ